MRRFTHTHIPRLRSVTSSKDWKYRPNENHQLHPLYPSFVGCILMFETTPQNLWVKVEPVAAPPVPCVGCPCAWSEGCGPPPEASAAHAAVDYTAWAGVDVSPPCAHDSRLALDPHNALHLGVDNPEQQAPRFGCWKILESHQPPCLFGNLRPGFFTILITPSPRQKGQHARLADDQRQAPSLATSHHSTIFQGDPVAGQAEGTPARLSSVGGSFQAWQMLECNRGFSWFSGNTCDLDTCWLRLQHFCAKQNMEPPKDPKAPARLRWKALVEGPGLPFPRAPKKQWLSR